MQIKRIQDKVFQLKLTEDEARMISDHTEVDFHLSKLISCHLGANVFHYMSEACKFPECSRPAVDVEL